MVNGVLGYSDARLRAVESQLRGEARVFHVSAAQYWAMEAATWDSYPPEALLPPFPVLELRVDGTAMEPTIDNPKVLIRTDWLLLDATRPEKWLVMERCTFKRPEVSGVAILGTLLNVTTGEVVPLEDNPMSGVALREYVRMARVALTFLQMRLHRQVHTPAIDVATNRQQRRAMERDGLSTDHYLVKMRPTLTVDEVLRNVHAGEHLRHPRPHDVAAHWRQLRSGKRVPVRWHRRGGTPQRTAEYDARGLPVPERWDFDF
jgi:hypothetical protein